MSNITFSSIQNASELSNYLNHINKFDLLTKEEEYNLALALEKDGDVNAAHKLVTSHLRLVAKIALSYKSYGLPIMDLISEGNIGLMKAVKKFNIKRGFRLSTYAMWWIKAAIQEYILRSWSLVKIGTTIGQKKLFFNLNKIKKKIHKYEVRELSNNDTKLIANELGVTVAEVKEMDSRLSSDISLNNLVSNEDSTSELIDMLASDDDSQEVLFAQQEESQQRSLSLANALTHLKEREKEIIMQRQLTDSPKTLEDLSKIYKVSRERIRQIEARAIEKLRHNMVG